MDRMNALELIEHTIYSMDVDYNVQTLALALYLLTQKESLRERFDLGDYDYLADYPDEEESTELTESFLNQLTQTQDQFNQSNQAPQQGFNQQSPFTQRRPNNFVDDGTLFQEDKRLDAKIKRPVYQRDPNAGTAKNYQDLKCVRCKNTDYIDVKSLRQGDPLYANGYVCDGCAKNVVKSWR